MMHLLALKERVSAIASYFDTSRRVIYVDYPLHTNVGDLLINLGCEQFFIDQGLNIWKRYNYYDFPKTIRRICKDDVFLLHGGGNFGDIWFNFQSFRESILEQYPENRIIFLPQTVHYRSRERLAASVRKISAHKNLHVFARDFISLEKLQRAGLTCVSAAPDTAHALVGVLKPSGAKIKDSELWLVRQDKEASAPPPSLSGATKTTIDWDQGTFSFSKRMLHPFIVNTVKGVGRYGPSIDLHRLWYWHRDKMVADGVSLFSRYETIVTNRLHAMLLGLLLHRKVSAWDNSYGKLSAYYESWLRDIPHLNFFREPLGDQPELETVTV
ncbi:MAG TPA: polysaccharide pyruvyl transferase family protein [Terriglobales bacterium]